MTVIFHDGTAEQISDEAHEQVQDFIEFGLWYEALPKAEQDKLKKDLQQHDRAISDTMSIVSD